MAAFAEFSTTPSANVTCGGFSIAEGCPAANVNDVIRYILASGRQLYDTVSAISVSSLMPKSGGVFTAAPTLSGGGSFRYNASSSLISGATYFLPVGSKRPAAAEGVVVFYY